MSSEDIISKWLSPLTLSRVALTFPVPCLKPLIKPFFKPVIPSFVGWNEESESESGFLESLDFELPGVETT